MNELEMWWIIYIYRTILPTLTKEKFEGFSLYFSQDKSSSSNTNANTSSILATNSLKHRKPTSDYNINPTSSSSSTSINPSLESRGLGLGHNNPLSLNYNESGINSWRKPLENLGMNTMMMNAATAHNNNNNITNSTSPGIVMNHTNPINNGNTNLFNPTSNNHSSNPNNNSFN